MHFDQLSLLIEASRISCEINFNFIVDIDLLFHAFFDCTCCSQKCSRIKVNVITYSYETKEVLKRSYHRGTYFQRKVVYYCMNIQVSHVVTLFVGITFLCELLFQHSEPVHTLYESLKERISSYQPAVPEEAPKLDSPLMSVPPPTPAHY